MTLTNIEKAAKLMGWEVVGTFADGTPNIMRDGTINNSFKPYTNKPDLMDLECALGIDVMWNDGAECVSARQRTYASQDLIGIKDTQYFSSHPNKFTARANAVMAVVEQIYDRTNP